MGRRLLGVFMTVYMPTILMNIVGHSTMFFKPFFFEAQVHNKRLKIIKCHDVSFPGLGQPNCNAGAHNNVCQVHLHIAGAILKAWKQWMFLKISLILIVVKCFNFYISFSISNDLPRTSYLKMVDIWLIFNLFIPFVEVLLHTYKVNSRLTSVLALFLLHSIWVQSVLNMRILLTLRVQIRIRSRRTTYKSRKERSTTMELKSRYRQLK